MNDELINAISSLDSTLFWSVVAAIAVSTLVSTSIQVTLNFLFNTKLADAIRKRSNANLELLKAELRDTSKRYESSIKVSERTNLLQLEKRIEAIDEISELQRLMHEWAYDHQTLHLSTEEMKGEASVRLSQRWSEIQTHLRKLSVFFMTNRSPYLEEYQTEWIRLDESIQRLLDNFNTAFKKNQAGKSGEYQLNTGEITETADSLKRRIFNDAASYDQLSERDDI